MIITLDGEPVEGHGRLRLIRNEARQVVAFDLVVDGQEPVRCVPAGHGIVCTSGRGGRQNTGWLMLKRAQGEAASDRQKGT